MRKIIVLFCFLVFGFAQAQELNCVVTVNTDKLGNVNQQVFKTLQTSLTEFVNKTDWTGQNFKQQEKINCSMYITVSSQSSDQFTATIQVQSSRPVFNSTYASPVLNFNDKDFTFKYVEYENLTYNPSVFESNLVSVISFYSYIILGLDADSFVANSGTPYLESAQNIANLAQQAGGYRGWNLADGNNSRYFLINDLMSQTFNEMRQTSFLYHSGLDIMSESTKAAKEKIKASILNISKVYSVRPNALLTRVFYDAKSDEIAAIFSGGPSIPVSDLGDVLNKTSPLNNSKWAAIKF